MDEGVNLFLDEFPELQKIGHGKIKCSLSGHEMPCKLDVVKSYVRGKKFRSLRVDFGSLEPFIIASASKNRKYQLFCALTNCYINRKPASVQTHINGLRYKKALEKYESGEKKLFKEPLKKLDVTIKQERNDEMTSDSDEKLEPELDDYADPVDSEIRMVSSISGGDSWKEENDNSSSDVCECDCQETVVARPVSKIMKRREKYKEFAKKLKARRKQAKRKRL